jgi:hypothetical protein
MAMSGDWARAASIFSGAPKRVEKAITMALRTEAELLRRHIVQGLTNQAPGGKALKAPSPLTLAARRLKRKKGTKSLLVRGGLRNSFVAIVKGDTGYVGIRKSKKTKSGDYVADIARIQEEGSKPRIIPITPKMRRVLFALFREAGIEPNGKGAGKGVVVVTTPARPYIKPAFDRYREGADKRFMRRVAAALTPGGEG